MDTNTRITVSSGDRHVLRLAREINKELRLLRQQRRKYLHGDLELKEAVDQLPAEERELIILRFYEDKQLSEIAEILQENLSTVKSRLYRTLRKLREELEVMA